MTMSRDRVRFFLPRRYFQPHNNTSNGMWIDTCIRVLEKSFGTQDFGCFNWQTYLKHHTDGVWITCRPSQFARFIVYRCEADECINGVKDLQPQLQPETDLYTQIAKIAHVRREDVKAVLQAANYQGSFSPALNPNEIDVSTNEHKHPF